MGDTDYVRDPERFLKDDFWKDWDSPATRDGVKPVSTEDFKKAQKAMDDDRVDIDYGGEE